MGGFARAAVVVGLFGFQLVAAQTADAASSRVERFDVRWSASQTTTYRAQDEISGNGAGPCAREEFSERLEFSSRRPLQLALEVRPLGRGRFDVDVIRPPGWSLFGRVPREGVRSTGTSQRTKSGFVSPYTTYAGQPTDCQRLAPRMDYPPPKCGLRRFSGVDRMGLALWAHSGRYYVGVGTGAYGAGSVHELDVKNCLNPLNNTGAAFLVNDWGARRGSPFFGKPLAQPLSLGKILNRRLRTVTVTAAQTVPRSFSQTRQVGCATEDGRPVECRRTGHQSWTVTARWRVTLVRR